MLFECHKLSAFKPASLQSVVDAFKNAKSISSGQAWRKRKQRHFEPMEIRIGWRNQALLVFAELTDRDIQTRATANNQRLWELGDVFEIFLRPKKQDAYVELQVAPNNLRLQLRYPNAAAVAQARKTGDATHFILNGRKFSSATWLRPDIGKWFVLAKIPIKTVCSAPKWKLGDEWLFSFSRYDYSSDLAEPVISSSSPHSREDFHQQSRWNVMRFSI